MQGTKAIVYILKNNVNVTALTSTIYAIEVSQAAAAPYIVVTPVAVLPADTKTGVSTLDTERIQIDNYAKSFGVAATTAETIRTALDRAAHTTYNSVELKGIKFLNYQTEYETETKLYRIISEYQVRIKR